VRRLGRIRQAKAGEGGLVARRELVGRVESGEQREGRAASGWWEVESRESRERGWQMSAGFFIFFEGNFLVVENIRCFLLLMKGVFISS